MAGGVGSGRVGQAMNVVRQWRHCAAIAFGWWFASAASAARGELTGPSDVGRCSSVRKRERRKQIVQVVVVRGKSFRFSRDKMVDGQQWESVDFGHESVASRVSSKCFIVVVGVPVP